MRSEAEVSLDNSNQLLVSHTADSGSIRINEDRKRLSDTDGVGHLDKAAVAQLGGDQGLGDPAGGVGGGAVDLGGVLSGESATSVGAPASVGIDDDFAASETGITVRSTDNEAAGGVEDDLGVLVHQLLGHNLIDDFRLQVLADVFVSDSLIVLGGDEDSVNPLRNHLALSTLDVFDDDLGLAVRTNPLKDSLLAHVGQALAELGGEHVSERHQRLLVFISSVAEHMSLVSSSDFVLFLVDVDALGDVRGLRLDGDEDGAGSVVEAFLLIVVANLLEGFADDLLVVHGSLGGDFSEDHDHAGLGAGFARNLRVRVACQARVEDGVGDLVADLVGVALVDGLGGEEEGKLFGFSHI
mmetsp:Transcript_15011/g.27022  ORF Transcript_15011/g.27022 Transcript_15011/m.27022 type:complete len:355 (-) Transcript_15011:97-1161(-)